MNDGEYELVPTRPRNCERELKAKNAENARLREELEAELERRRRLEKRVAELERQLGAAAPASADDVARGTPTWASSAESAATLRPTLEPARPRNCERELKAKNAENAWLREELKAELERRGQLEKRVEELEQQLEVVKRPHRPIRPHGDMGPGGPGFGP
jgi:chromosome segregation ATPase